MTNVSRIVALGSSIHCILQSLEAPGGPDSNDAVAPGLLARVFGGLETPEAGSDECLEDRVLGRLNLSYSTKFGSSWEGQIPTAFWFGVWRLEVTNVSRIVARGGSICRILRGLEAPGGPGSNQAN